MEKNENSTFKDVFRKYVWGWLCPVIVVYIIIIVQIFMAIPLQLAEEKIEGAFFSTLSLYLSAFCLPIVTIPYIYFIKKNRTILRAFGKKAAGNNLKNALFGALGGFALAGSCVALAALNHDIILHFDCFEFFPLLILFVAVLVQASGEEVLFRGYLFQRLRKEYKNPAVAFFVGGIAFSLPHMFTPGATLTAFFQIFLAGVIMTEMVYYDDSFWMACTFHTLWNYTQHIIFGIPVSGRVTGYSIFRIETAAAQDSFFYNVEFSLEASASSCILLLAGCIGIYLWGKKHPPKPIDVWELENK